MSGFEAGLGLFAVLLILIALKVPIGLAMLVAGMAGFIHLNGLMPLVNLL